MSTSPTLTNGENRGRSCMSGVISKNAVNKVMLALVAVGFYILGSHRGGLEVMRILQSSPPPSKNSDCGDRTDESDAAEGSTKSITNVIAASSFPMDSKTSKIRLPPSVTSVMIDIGARESDYLHAMESSEDESVALLLFDPLPDSNIPLAKRVAEYSMRNIKQVNDDDEVEPVLEMDKVKSRQVFLSKVAVGEREGIANFNVASGPACSSILETSSKNKF